MTTISVIGSNSFSGSHFIDSVLEKTDYNVIGISRSEEYNLIFLPYKSKSKGRFEFFKRDLNKDLEDIINIFDKLKIEKLVNFAAQGMVGQSWINPEHWFKTNTLGIVSLTNKLKEKNYFKKYVQISSPEIYGSCNGLKEEHTTYNPSTPYAVSKAAGDMFIQTLIKQYKFPANFVRSTNVYGPAQQLFRIIPKTIIYGKLGRKIKLDGGGKAVKSYIHIRDVCNGIIKIMETEKTGEVYHLSPDSGISIENIVRKICSKLGKSFEEIVEIAPERPGQDAEYIINSEKARKELDWKPEINIDIGLDECIDWVEKNWKTVRSLSFDYIHKE